MGSNDLSEAVADRTVEALFDDAVVLRFDRLLLPWCRGVSLLEAVERYCAGRSMTPPKTTVLSTDEAVVDRLPEGVDGDYGGELDVRQADFLAEDVDLSGPFDYVLCDPPQFDWEALPAERRKEYAASLSQVRPDDTDITGEELYVERSLSFLRPSGRGAFLVSSHLKRIDEPAAARKRLVPLVNDILPVATVTGARSDERLITIVTGPGEGEYDPDDRVNRPDPSAIESQLATTASEIAADRTAGAIMTPIEEMTLYAAEADAAAVYLDLLSEDYDASLVYEEGSRPGQLHGYVARPELRVEGDESIVDHTTPIPPDRCLEPSAGLDRLIPRLGEYRFAFVGSPTDPAGIVTRYDLNKLPVYHQLYDQFARFEIGLRRFVRDRAPDWDDRVSGHGVHGARELVPDRLSTLQLSDLVDVVADLGLEDALVPTADSPRAELDDLVTLRNEVAHYNPIVHVMSSRPTAADPERGAPQLADEYELLSRCLESLYTPDR